MGWFGFARGRFGDTVRWGVRFGLGCRRSGRYGDTIRLGRSAWWPVGRNTLVGLLHCWDDSGDTMVCGRANVLHTDVGRYRSGRFAIPCNGCVEQWCHVRVGLPTVGALWRYHPSGSEWGCYTDGTLGRYHRLRLGHLVTPYDGAQGWPIRRMSAVCGRTEEPVVLSQLHLFERHPHRDAVAVPHGPGAGRCVFTGAVEEKTVLSQMQSVEKICSCSECRAMSNKGSAPVDLGTLRRFHGLCEWKAPF